MNAEWLYTTMQVGTGGTMHGGHMNPCWPYTLFAGLAWGWAAYWFTSRHYRKQFPLGRQMQFYVCGQCQSRTPEIQAGISGHWDRPRFCGKCSTEIR